MRKQILFRRYCNIGKAQFQFANILPEMHFFDAWQIVPTLQIKSDNHADLDSFEEVLSPREKWEFRAQTDARTNAQLAQEQTLQIRAQNKTSAQMASKIAQVHKLTTLLAEQVDFLADLACSRHGYMDQIKTRTTAKTDKKELKRRAGDDPIDSAFETASVPATSGAHTTPMEVLQHNQGANKCFFFLRLPNGQYGPVSQLSRSEKCCTGPFNWGEAHCAGEKVKRKIGLFQRKSL